MKLTTAYLLAYNFLQLAGWTLIFGKLMVGLLGGIQLSQVYGVLFFEVQLFQTLMIMEIFHAAFGLVRSPLGTTALQIFSRITIVWPVTWTVVSARSSVGVAAYVFAWSLTEVIRYSYYALALLDSIPYALQWARYTLFIVLYPVGVLGEVATCVSALPEIRRRKVLSVEMPNAGNMAFSFYYALLFFLFLYIPFFPQLYFYMFAQRKKVLGRETVKKQE